LGVTGYGKNQWQNNQSKESNINTEIPVVYKTEISALARAMNHLGIQAGTLVDIGGQDCKILKIRNGKLQEHALNRRCAAGTGSYLEFTGFRMGLEPGKMSELAAQEKEYYPLNSFCTVFAGTEILDCIKKNVSLPRLIRGLYASIVERVREIAVLDAPVYLSGGVIAYHPMLLELFQIMLGKEIPVAAVPDSQFLASLGIALYAKDQALAVINNQKGNNSQKGEES
jgi:activator of 2-hydroxyglutaryl-CoA dehydratase